DAVQYSSTSDNPTNFGTIGRASCREGVNDGALNNSTNQTTTLNITAVDDAPVLSNGAARASYPQNGGTVTLSPTATVSDVDNQTLASATVSISSGFLTGDVLAFTNTSSTTYGNITAIYNNAGVLTLTSAGATATLAQWQAALDAVQYSSTSDNPTNFGTDTSRTISWVVNDGALNNSTIPTTTLTIVAKDNAPVLSNVAASASYTENAAPVTLSSAATVTDDDIPPLASATVSISSGFFTGDVLAANVAGTSITASYANRVLTLTFPTPRSPDLAALDAVQYSSTSDNPTNFGTDTSRTIS